MADQQLDWSSSAALQQLQFFRVSDLKMVLRSLKLGSSGNKTALTNRIVSYSNRGPAQEKTVAEVINQVSLQLNSGPNASERNRKHLTMIRSLQAPSELRDLDPFSEHIKVLYGPTSIVGGVTRPVFHIDTEDYLKVACPPTNTSKIMVQIRSVDLDHNGKHKNDRANSLRRPTQRWPPNTMITINRLDLNIVQKHTGDKVNGAVHERPADISKFVEAGYNELSIANGNCNCQMSVDLVRYVSPAEHVTRLRAKSRISFAEGKLRIETMFGKHKSDDDDEIYPTSMIIKLKCPLGLARIQTPARGKSCPHAQCFDLLTFLSFQETAKNASWSCPVCNHRLSISDIVVDGWFEELLTQTSSPGKVIDRVELNESAEWQTVGGAPRDTSRGNETNDGGAGGSTSNSGVGTKRQCNVLLVESDSEDEEERELAQRFKKRREKQISEQKAAQLAQIRLQAASRLQPMPWGRAFEDRSNNFPPFYGSQPQSTYSSQISQQGLSVDDAIAIDDDDDSFPF